MAINQTDKIVWLVDIIRKHGYISYKDLNQKWKENIDISGGIDLPKRTLHKWIDNILDTFGIIVANEGRGEYRYYLENPDELKNGSMEQWLYDTLSVSNTLIENKSLHHRILLEQIPSGRVHLTTVMAAMKQNRRLRIIYHDYFENIDSILVIEPYMLRLWHQRWYVVAHITNNDKTRRFCLDRILRICMLDETFAMPEDFSGEEFFRDCYGVINDDNGPKVTRVLLKATAFQANYIRDLPLHESQREIERTDGYSVFELHIRPYYDFYQEGLRLGTQVEILEPQYMRDELRKMTEGMFKRYQ